jgi:hypothetical protein
MRGDDVITGGFGSDRLEGGADNDTYHFSQHSGADTIFETHGIDTIYYHGNALAGGFSLSGDLIGGLSGPERIGNNLVLSFRAGTTITIDDYFSSSGNNRVERFVDGNEGLINGPDTTYSFLVGTGDLTPLRGESGNRSYVAALANSTAANVLDDGDASVGLRAVSATDGPSMTVLAATSESDDPIDDWLLGAEGTDTLVAHDGDDVLLGFGQADNLDGGSGDDFLDGGSGADRLDGGAHATLGDTAIYIFAPGGVTVSLATGVGTRGDASGDTLFGIENLAGSDHADELTGDAGGNILFGLGGDDRIQGGSGADGIHGGLGNDVLDGDAGTDLVLFDGNRADYGLNLLANGDLRVVDQRPGSPDGTDTLHDVENIAFADRTVAPVAVGDALWRHSEGTPANGNYSLPHVSNNWEIQGTGDFDADGDSDIVWRHQQGQVLTWEMHNGQLFTHHTNPFAPTGWEIVDTGDFDADGDDDFLWRHQEGAVVTWEMESNAYVVNHNIAFASPGWRIDGMGDFDRDGDSDVIWRHFEGWVVTWEMEDGGYVVNHNIELGSNSWQIQGTGDFDGDGDDDILWRHDQGAVVTWEMQNGAYVRNHSIEAASGSWGIEGTGDFNADGTDDILWRHEDGTVVTWQMDDGEFSQARIFGVVSNAWQIRGTGEFDLL